MSSANVNRAAMSLLTRSARAFFAPVERNSGAVASFDPADGPFPMDAPPLPWIDAGPVRELRRSGESKLSSLHAGPEGATVKQFRKGLDARVDFSFVRWGKLQMAIAGGSTHVNVLAKDTSGITLPAIAVLSGSTTTEIVVGDGVANFSEGDIVAVDCDYHQESGYIGTGIAGAFVAPSCSINDVDFVRRVTFNVARVTAKTNDRLLLSQPLITSPFAGNCGVQRVVAFADREGGSFFQEWSGLFVLQSETGGQVCFYYPRLQSAAATSENRGEAGGFDMPTLHASLIALPVRDDIDGELALCYRTHFPAECASIY